MIRKPSPMLTIVSILAAVAGLVFFVLEEGETEVSINGVVCNRSSTGIWIALGSGERQSTYSLPPGQCTDFFTEDAEAIWGRDCTDTSCQYQAWKVSAGRFEVREDSRGSSDTVLRIRGWGAGSRWHITGDWPRPALSSVDYSLVR